MIETKNLIPDIYNTSYDFTIFKALFDIVFNDIDSKIPAILSLHSPDFCYEENLQKLAAFFNISADRKVIKAFSTLIKNKGTPTAISTAAYLCGANEDYEPVKIITKDQLSEFLENLSTPGGFQLFGIILSDKKFNYPLFKKLMYHFAPAWATFTFIPQDKITSSTASYFILSKSTS